MGLALLLVIWAITFASSYFFAAHTWWLPPLASATGGAIDAQFNRTFVAMGIVFIAAQVGLGLFVWKYRDQSGTKVEYSHGNTRLEVIWTALTALLFLGLAAVGAQIWAAERFVPAEPGAFQVEVTGMQFAWYFRYPGKDAKYGRTLAENIDPSAGSEAAIGLDTTDPAAKDDVVTSVMVVPVNHQIDLTLRSVDVIHSFFVPAMRFKQDAVPGLMIHMHLTPAKEGDYEVACAELCGLGHYKMRAMMRVVSQSEFDNWMAQRIAEKQ
ncbi:MAG TPA: cytochrome c oxidase subunit II [Terriglobales bacterium]|nr:cytochrome c oxidase subunit II [Terriglobales bacterium]